MAIEFKLPKQPVTVKIQEPKTESDRHDDLVAVVPLKVTAEVTPDTLSQVCYGMLTGFQAFWYGMDGQLKCEVIGKTYFKSDFKDHKIILAHNDVENLELTGVIIRGFSAEPQSDGRVVLSFTLKVKPTMNGMHYITDGLISDSWTLEVIGAIQGDLLDEGQEEAA